MWSWYLISLDFWEHFFSKLLLRQLKSNIKPQNEQNFFRIGGGFPLPYPHLNLVVTETSEGAHDVGN